MFNSPINRLFGVKGISQDNKQSKQNKREDEKKEEKKNFFDDDTVLYTDISSETFDIEKFIRNYFETLKQQQKLAPKAVKKIDEFLTKFDIKVFEKHHGENLSKEDVSIILYSLADKWGCYY